MTFLSIDIDFWKGLPATRLHCDLTTICVALQDRGVPIQAVMNHHQLLREVARSHARRLVNVDMHSDLTYMPVGTVTCGNWVAHVPWHEDGQYEWVRRHSLIDGECDYPHLFGRGKNGTRWRHISTRRVTAFPWAELDNGMVAAGICMSPGYSDSGFDAVMREVVKAHGVPYRRGRVVWDYMT